MPSEALFMADEAKRDMLAETAAHARAILLGVNRGLVSFDAGGLVRFANPAAAAILELGDATPAPGTRLADVLGASRLLDAADRAGIAALAAATASDRQPRELVIATPGIARSIAADTVALADGTALLRLEDVTERCAAAARALEAAQHDALTGLPGRAAFSRELARALETVPAGEVAALLMIDLDRFKAVNDTLGHGVGDELLRLAARRMRSVVDAADIVTRFGGDEFGVLLRRSDLAAVDAVGAQLAEIVGRPYLAAGHLVAIGASIGIAAAPAHATDAETLLAYADLALYSVKSQGRGGCARFEPGMHVRAHGRRLLELDLRRAIALEQLELHYQPQVALASDRLSGFEALVRWRHPERGMVSPAEFIPMSEEIGLIGPIGEWVLRTACREAAGWPEPLTLAVNVSPRQFERAGLVDTVRAALAAGGLAPARLELEVTESVLMCNEAAVLATLHELRALGVRIAMDDFGTGYSSLSQLRSFPFDKIKIDRSFVSNLAATGGVAIIRAITAMGASLGMTTIAEGVETSEDLASIRAEGCDAVQGYVFSRPVPASELPALFDRLATTAD